MNATLSQPAQQNTVPNGYTWYTEYNIEFGFTAPGPWGDYITFRNVLAENYSKRVSENALEFNFLAETIIDGYRFEFDILFDSTLPPATYYLDNLSHDGANFENITLKISQVPIPSAALLLGTGLVGLFTFRRRVHKA